MNTYDNEVVVKVAANKQTRFGCEGKHWFSYKEQVWESRKTA